MSHESRIQREDKMRNSKNANSSQMLNAKKQKNINLILMKNINLIVFETVSFINEDYQY